MAALLLQRRGWEVAVFERVTTELSGRGAGIVAQAELIERLRGLRLETTDLGVPVTVRRIWDAAGRIIAEIEIPQILTAWERVYRV
ncbi:MAG TPA: hypothetical protein VNZ53_22690, partial [Steroidobacteraceae bacterium]|nr:hypothetical protein [Steroidobacteraceae bacterium]